MGALPGAAVPPAPPPLAVTWGSPRFCSAQVVILESARGRASKPGCEIAGTSLLTTHPTGPRCCTGRRGPHSCPWDLLGCAGHARKVHPCPLNLSTPPAWSSDSATKPLSSQGSDSDQCTRQCPLQSHQDPVTRSPPPSPCPPAKPSPQPAPGPGGGLVWATLSPSH